MMVDAARSSDKKRVDRKKKVEGHGRGAEGTCDGMEACEEGAEWE